MRTLDTKEWIAVVISLVLVGFFFIFGSFFISLFGNEETQAIMQAPQLVTQDEVVGGGQVASAGDRVTVHYTGRFVDGTVFDSSVSRGEPFQFVLGVGQVIKGWDDGVSGMREGGKRIISIPPELGYGMNDYGPIPGGSTLIFEVELIRVDKAQ